MLILLMLAVEVLFKSSFKEKQRNKQENFTQKTKIENRWTQLNALT